MKSLARLLPVVLIVCSSSLSFAQPFRFTVSADNRPYDGGNRNRFQWAMSEMERVLGDEGVFHIMPGDFDGPQTTDDDLKAEFGPDTVWYPIVGNHEAETAGDMTWVRNAYAGLPNIVNAGPTGSSDTTYSFDYGNAHFIALNQYFNGTADNYAAGGDVIDALYDWLVADLNANTKPVVFVIGHEPAYPENRHIGDSLDQFPANRDRFWQLLNDRGVIAYFCGHTHYYSTEQRSVSGEPALTWQVDVGNSGNGSPQTFVDVTVTNTDVTFGVWQGDQNQPFTNTESWVVDIPVPDYTAYNPDPTDGALDVPLDATLRWSAGPHAASFDVYFGTDSANLPLVSENQTASTFDPGTLTASTVYYWAVDVVEADTTTHPGAVWGFTTVPPPPGPATSPSPVHTAIGVDVLTDLSWAPVAGATSYDVYFSTDGGNLGNATSVSVETFDPGPLEAAQSYYWRVDSVGAGGTTAGALWSFTTAAAPGVATNPQPPDGTLGVTLNADLSWIAGAGATGHDVYFGIDPLDVPQVSADQPATTFDPGLLEPATTYYWAIDEVGPGGVTVGPAWSFTTAALPWGDGFESGDIASGGWTPSGPVQITDDAFTGSYAVRTNRAALIERVISTVGFGSITISYACKTSGMDSGESLYVEWSVDGSSWNEMDSTPNTTTQWTRKSGIPCSDPAAQDNPDFRMRFRSNANKNREYAYIDDIQVSGTPLGPDSDPPTPDPMTFAVPPYATGESSISMTATTASDPSGVEYYFTCTDGGGSDSGWQDSPTYSDTGLHSSTTYKYTVKARDKSVSHNETAPSAEASATTNAPDGMPPTPDPMTFAVLPHATSTTAIAMTATTASDPSGVEYYFTCTDGGGNHSGWQDSPTYQDTGLQSNTTYTYTVEARDKSPAQNTTSPSAETSATTLDSGGSLVYVQAVQLDTKTAGKNYFVNARVEIRDTSGAAVEGVAVTGAWSGASSGTSNGTTDATGMVTLSMKVPSTGTYYFAVTGVVIDGYTYDPSLNNTEMIDTEVTIP